jgi:hypothetical protein
MKKEFKIEFDYRPLLRPIVAGLVMFSAIFYSLRFIGDMTLFIGIFEVLGGMIIYFAFLFLIKGITLEDFKLARYFIPRQKTNNL